jgi:hypothetical protein
LKISNGYFILYFILFNIYTFCLLNEELRHQNASFLNNRPTCPYQSDDINPPTYQEAVVRINTRNDLKKHDDYLLFSIFNLLCCFACFGIPAVYYSVKSRKEFKKGFFDMATKNAKFAKKLNIAGFVVGAIIIVILILIQLYIHRELMNSIEKGHRKEMMKKNLKQAKEFQKDKLDQEGK